MQRKRVLAVDCIAEVGSKIVLIKRKYGRFRGKWALPGGLVEMETVSEAAKREVREETGLDVSIEGIVGIYSKPDRDERGIVTIVFHGKANGMPKAGSDAEDAVLVEPRDAASMDLAFDHRQIIRDWMEGKRCKFD